MSLNAMIDRSVSCLKCGTQGVGNCECRREIVLRCPDCKREKTAPVDDTDPDGTALIVLTCPECNGGDFQNVDYYDVNGKQLHLD